jgi:hypothetical protein
MEPPYAPAKRTAQGLWQVRNNAAPQRFRGMNIFASAPRSAT